ncbi:MAG: 23S rRNA (guanosine(2251)-2'-O)-methyltransferase RlmB [Candidatus Hydrogenedentota bacterium]
MQRVVGRIPVLECLRAGKRTARRLFVLQGARGIDDIRQAAGTLPVKECSRRELDDLTEGIQHQGVVLETDDLPVYDLTSWLRRHDSRDVILVLLDGIEDPHNFGAIVRSASACGAAAVVIAKDRSAPISPTAVKSAAGAMEHIDIIQTVNLVRAMESVKEAGFWIAALDPEGEKALWEADLKGRIALVVGNEGEGIRRLVRENCDFFLRIPMPGPIPSLNASVSAAIALAECVRQRVISSN